MDYDFSYVIEKIRTSPVVHEPFQHVHIEDLFLPEHFEAIRTSPEIASPPAASDAELIEHLAAVGYEVIHFPGALTDVAEYQRWHARKEYDDRFGGVCEGFGLVLRLGSIASPILRAVNDLILSEPFNRAIAEKFGVDFDACHFDGGIQKYLDGYEISPHAHEVPRRVRDCAPRERMTINRTLRSRWTTTPITCDSARSGRTWKRSGRGTRTWSGAGCHGIGRRPCFNKRETTRWSSSRRATIRFMPLRARTTTW